MIKCKGKLTKDNGFLLSEINIFGNIELLLLELSTVHKVLIGYMRGAEIPEEDIEKTLIQVIKAGFDLADAEAKNT